MWAMIYKYTHSSTPWSLNRVEALVDLEGIEPSLRVYKTRVLAVERQIQIAEVIISKQDKKYQRNLIMSLTAKSRFSFLSRSNAFKSHCSFGCHSVFPYQIFSGLTFLTAIFPSQFLYLNFNAVCIFPCCILQFTYYFNYNFARLATSASTNLTSLP